jgi:hypothetical protein
MRRRVKLKSKKNNKSNNFAYQVLEAADISNCNESPLAPWLENSIEARKKRVKNQLRFMRRTARYSAATVSMGKDNAEMYTYMQAPVG